MPKISDAEIAGYAKGAGLSGNAVAIAVAIALAESGGNTESHNPIPPDDSYGLWQINMLGSMGPARRKQFGLSSNADLYNPATNARVMFSLSNGGANWKPWTTYTSGKYRMFMARGNAAAGNPASTGNGGSTGTVVPVGFSDTIDGIKKAFDTLTDAHTWVRVGLFIGGFVLLVIALFKLTGDNKISDTTKAAAKLAIKVAK